MAARYEKQKGDVLAGVIATRAPDGSILHSRNFYKPSPAHKAATKTGKLTAGEQEVCEGIVQTMVELFGEYIKSINKLDQRQKKAQATTAKNAERKTP